MSLAVKFTPGVIAHRGAWRASSLPQNSLAALRRAIAIGCDGSECDVHLSADNVLVVNHDADWGGLQIATSSYEALCGKKLANGEVLPRLGDFLEEITRPGNAGTKLLIELKSSTLGTARTGEAARLLLQAVKAAGAQERVEYLLFDYKAAQALLAAEPLARVFFLGGTVEPSQLQQDGFAGLDYAFDCLRKRPQWLAQAAELGLASNVWTVNEPQQMHLMLDAGVQEITTDEPEALLEQLRPPALGLPRDPGLVVFAYSDVGYACLKLILEQGVRVRAVFTHEDDPQEAQWFGSVSELAAAYAVPVYRPQKITRALHEELIFKTLGARLLLSFYYRNLLPTWLWGGMELGAFNMHGSYLPSYRGRAPLNWAIINGEDHTGVTLHWMVKEADAGDIVDQEKVMIGKEQTAISVREHACAAAVRVMERQLANVLCGRAPRHVQDLSKVSYFGKRTPEDGRIDWSQPAPVVFNLVRALTRPYPGAFTELGADGQPLAKAMDTPLAASCPAKTTTAPSATAAEPLEAGRLLVWWGRVRDDLQGEPGQVLSVQPLIIACGHGAFEITDCEQQ